MISNKNLDQVMRVLEVKTKIFPQPIITAIRKEVNSFQILVVTLLSARTKDKILDKIIPELFKICFFH